VVDDDTFIPGKGHGVVRIPARNGKEIEVELECWENVEGKWKPVPPPLPVYPQ
jgi:hypothetical protein